MTRSGRRLPPRMIDASSGPSSGTLQARLRVRAGSSSSRNLGNLGRQEGEGEAGSPARSFRSRFLVRPRDPARGSQSSPAGGRKFRSPDVVVVDRRTSDDSRSPPTKVPNKFRGLVTRQGNAGKTNGAAASVCLSGRKSRVNSPPFARGRVGAPAVV